MVISALIGAGIKDAEALFPPAAVDLDALPWREGLPRYVLLPGIYVVAEPVGDAPWAGTLCTNWRHAAGAPASPCGFCGIGQA